MFSEYKLGRTPNPDILCNREIKFEAFLKTALELGADCVATGHYCIKETEINPEGQEVYRLLAGTDPNKDQSYFLCQLSQEQLSKALFPWTISKQCSCGIVPVLHEKGYNFVTLLFEQIGSYTGIYTPRKPYRYFHSSKI